jgi:endospore appendages protein
MKRSIWSALIATVVLGTSVIAQDTVRLQIQAYRNGTQVGAPTISVAENQTGSVTVNGVASVSLSPKRIDAENLSLDLEVVAGDKTMKPRLVLRRQEPGSMKWQSSSGNDSFELRISLLR